MAGRILLLGGDDDLDVRRDLAGDLDVDRVVAERLDGLGERDLAAVDLVTLGGERLLDVPAVDRAEELALLTDLALERDHRAGEAAGDALGVLAGLGRLRLDLLAVVLHLGDVLARRR